MEAHGSAPSQAGVIKRIRQACASCRRRKIKCSGERPTCAHCRQNRRSCVYEPYSTTATKDGASGLIPPGATLNVTKPSAAVLSMPCADPAQADLMQRIASIETALSRLSQTGFEFPGSQGPSPSAFMGSPPRMAQTHGDLPPANANFDPQGNPTVTAASILSFDQLPPLEVLRSLVETYFSRAHNKPYSFFHQATFWHRLETNSLPKCLVLAVIALAVRFTENPYFLGKIQEASNAYSKQSWLTVIEDHLSVDNNLDLQVIQTVTLLSIVDYTAGRVSSGWLRLGLAIRLSQDVDLMSEPPDYLPVTEREERRRTFWSIYLVDKLISCARSRPAAILDRDCSLHVPCDEETFTKEEHRETPTLQQMQSWDGPLTNAPSLFSLTVVTASIFGRCTRYAHGQVSSESQPPWDPKSDFTETNAALLLLESHLNNRKQSIIDLVRNGPRADEAIDVQQIGHLVFAHSLFHLCHCLLNHPFLMRLRLRPIATRAPSSFAQRAFNLAQEHARQMTDLLTAASAGRVYLESSFYTYCAAVAAGIHSLSAAAQNQGVRLEPYDAAQYFQQCMEALQKLAWLWPMVPNMLSRLNELNAQAPAYASLFDVKCLAEDLEAPSERFLWTTVDYGILARDLPTKPAAPISFLSNLPSPDSWNMPPDQYASASPTDVRNALLFMDVGVDGSQFKY